jgi:hypothetical protein
MADASFTPTFDHTDWQDHIDRVEAGGPNGFNVRFRAIERDLRALSTVVGSISARITRIHTSASGPNQELRFALTPVLHLADDGNDPNEWFTTEVGVATASAGHARGIMNVNLPDRVRLTSMRVRGAVRGPADGTTTLTITLFRTAVHLTSAAATLEPVVPFRTGDRGDLNLVVNITGGAAVVDLDAFRYLIDATFDSDAQDGHNIDLSAIEFTYQPR